MYTVGLRGAWVCLRDGAKLGLSGFRNKVHTFLHFMALISFLEFLEDVSFSSCDSRLRLLRQRNPSVSRMTFVTLIA